MGRSPTYGSWSKVNSRPEFMRGEPNFFVCRRCCKLLIESAIKNRTQSSSIQITCCGRKMSRLIPHADLPHTKNSTQVQHIPKFTIRGGFSSSSIEVRIDHTMSKEHHIEWVYLYTFQGGQFKFLRPTQEPRLTFATTDEDAYAYCGRSVCKMGWDHCMFQCKRDLVIYAYCNLHGLWQIRM